MKDDDFCQMFLYSLINLICFLLKVIFLTAMYNVRSQVKLLGIDQKIEYGSDVYKDLEMYDNSYKATAALFAFNFICFLGFMIVLFMIINTIKAKRTDYDQNNNIGIQVHQNNDDINTDERIANSGNTRNSISDDKIEGINKLLKFMLFFFLFSQFIFLIELIVVSVYHNKSSDFEGITIFKTYNLDYFTKIYRDLMIVGYIFFVIFILFDLYTIILVTKCGRRVELRQDNMEDLENQKYCDCFSDCLINCCEKMGDIFHGCEREGDESLDALKKKLEKLKEQYDELNKYSEKLKTLNDNIKNNNSLASINTGLEELNLPRSKISLATTKIEIKTKK